MSLVEYCIYLQREIHSLKSQISKLKSDLADALAQRNLYEPLIPSPPPSPKKKSYWEWFSNR